MLVEEVASLPRRERIFEAQLLDAWAIFLDVRLAPDVFVKGCDPAEISGGVSGRHAIKIAAWPPSTSGGGLPRWVYRQFAFDRPNAGGTVGN